MPRQVLSIILIDFPSPSPQHQEDWTVRLCIFKMTASTQTRSPPRLAQAAIGIFLLTAICVPSLYQPLLSRLWQNLSHSSLYRFSGFETLLTITCYAVLEPLYTYKFGHNPHLRIDVRSKAQKSDASRPPLPKMKRPKHRLGEFAIYAAPLLLMDSVLIKKYHGVPASEIRRSGGYDMLDSNVSPYFLRPTIHKFSWSSPLQLERALPDVCPTSRQIVLQLMTAIFIYDALFFATHLAFHKIPILARFHNPHHTHPEMHPQVTNRLSVTERLSLVLLANYSLNIVGSHVLTRTLFVPLFVYLLIEVHSGMDLPWGYHNLLPAGMASGPRKHAEHHRTGGGGYAPFFTWCDAGYRWIVANTGSAKA